MSGHWHHISFEIALEAFLLGIDLQLRDEARVGVDLHSSCLYFGPLTLHHADDFSEGRLVPFHEVGHDNRHTATDTGHTMHQNIGLLPSLLDELVGLVEMLMQFVIFVVFGRNVEIMRNGTSRMTQQTTSGHRENSSDFEGCARTDDTLQEREIAGCREVGDVD